MNMINPENLSLLDRKSNGNPILQPKRSSTEWGEESSSCSSSSCYSGSCSEDSYIANWENFVCPDGSLFYSEYINYVAPRLSTSENALHVIRNDFSRASTRRSDKKNKLSRLMNKSGNKEDRLAAQAQAKELDRIALNQNPQAEVKEVDIVINPDNRFKFGRRASMVESLLGISTCPFRDGIHVMVSGFIINSGVLTEKSTKVGDWFKSINDVEINVQNMNEILSQFTKPTKVKLKFQKNIDEDQSNYVQQITNFEMFVLSANKILLPTLDTEKEQTNKNGFSLMILNLDFSDNESLIDDVIFCYPQKDVNDLYPVRGSFLTLNSILKMELKTELLSTTVIARGVTWNVCFYLYEKVILAFGISALYSSLKETKLRMTELIQYIRFCYDTLDPCLPESIKQELQYLCEIVEVRLQKYKDTVLFETLMSESRLVSLPKEAQLRIFDALSEMEAMDYRDWNEEPLNSHREFFIFGSALFFRSYLLASLIPISQLAGIESFMRCRGIFDFIERQTVRELVIWIEIPMTSSSNRFFLVVTSRNQLTLAVILQAFESERRISDAGTVEEKIIKPSLFYIEEIQETLDHLRHGGIEALARVWIASNKRPEIISNVDDQLNRRKSDGVSMLKYTSMSSDELRINSSMGGSSVHSLTHSEDSNKNLDDCDSDSDWDGFPDSHKSSSGFDMSEMRDSFLKEISDVVPSRITAGKNNVLLYYIHLDVGTGTILSPTEICPNLLINKFRAACHLIHTVLQNTKKFRRLLSQETPKPISNKSLVAIKEQGILINLGTESGYPHSFWVIGRLFASPTRELYVCHKSDVPQNLVEIAFRLSFLTSG